ncbi:MAG: hypothetical protein OJF58_000993 [Enhydrobacter sp.]|nr:MAG: hypothetical protein OJF58_000993 [Enhydrobacter sp.]
MNWLLQGALMVAVIFACGHSASSVADWWQQRQREGKHARKAFRSPP